MRRGICRSEIEIEIGTDWTNGTDRIGGKFVQQCDQMAGWFRWLRGGRRRIAGGAAGAQHTEFWGFFGQSSVQRSRAVSRVGERLTW